MKTVLITGGSGLIGKALTQTLLQKGYHVIVLTRHEKPQSTSPGVANAQWNIDTQAIDTDALGKADIIVHLAGAPLVEKKWTRKRRKEIIDSRVKSSELLVRAIRQINPHPKIVISASAIGWYGADKMVTGQETPMFKETDPAANDFIGQICSQWEEAINPMEQLGVRLVKFRIGIVLSKQSGALKELMQPMRFGIVPIIGNGKQVISWIHIDDLVSMFLKVIDDEHIHGVYNAVAPRPTTNKEMMKSIAALRKGKWSVPVHVPSIVLKAILGQRAGEVLKSATVSSDKILQTGFRFQYPGINDALVQLLNDHDD